MRNKRKGILMASAILGSAAIVSTGFAAWVITAPTETSTIGNIEVDTVTDNRVTMTATWATGDGTVSFGAPANQAADSWLRNDDMKEAFEHTLNVSFAVGDKGNIADVDGKVTATIVVGTGLGKDFTADKEQTSEYFNLPTFTPVNVSNGGTISIPVNFTWGTFFGGQNPYDYYTAHEANDPVADGSYSTWADKAVDELTDMATALANKTFKITLAFEFNDATN